MSSQRSANLRERMCGSCQAAHKGGRGGARVSWQAQPQLAACGPHLPCASAPASAPPLPGKTEWDGWIPKDTGSTHLFHHRPHGVGELVFREWAVELAGDPAHEAHDRGHAAGEQRAGHASELESQHSNADAVAAGQGTDVRERTGEEGVEWREGVAIPIRLLQDMEEVTRRNG